MTLQKGVGLQEVHGGLLVEGKLKRQLAAEPGSKNATWGIMGSFSGPLGWSVGDTTEEELQQKNLFSGFLVFWFFFANEVT